MSIENNTGEHEVVLHQINLPIVAIVSICGVNFEYRGGDIFTTIAESYHYHRPLSPHFVEGLSDSEKQELDRIAVKPFTHKGPIARNRHVWKMDNPNLETKTPHIRVVN